MLDAVGVSSRESDVKGSDLDYADAQGQRHEICGFFDWTYPQAVYYLDDRPQPPRVDRHQDPLRLR
jgi:hypothetical protein